MSTTDDTVMTDPTGENRGETKPDSITETTIDEKKARKLSQLAAARESAKQKKAKREADLETMQSKLDNLTALLSSKKSTTVTGTNHDPTSDDDIQSPTPKKRPKRVTTDVDSVQEDHADSPGDGWQTSAIRTGALLSLAAGSYYFQHVYGKAQKRRTHSKTSSSSPGLSAARGVGLQRPPLAGHVGKSGFAI